MNRFLVACLGLTFTLTAMSESSPTYPLWTGTPPNHQKSDLQEVETHDEHLLLISKVQTPTIEVRLPAPGSATGQAVVVCPGGGYGFLAYDWEGTDIASWLNSRGIAAIVLKYRLPEAASNVVPYKSPLLDAQRALRTVRARAAEWHIDPAKVGIMGFSAGGHLASTAATHFDAGNPEASDPIDQLSCRPDFAILIYPVISLQADITHGGSRQNLLGPDPTPELVNQFSNELQVTDETPPTFLLHAGDDGAVPVQNSLRFYAALQAHHVPAELHLYPYGGHGFALAIGRGRLQGWTQRCAEWLDALNAGQP